MGEANMIPAEVVEQLRRLHESITGTEDALEPIVSQRQEDRLKFSSLDQARCNLLSVFTINSFYWILMRMRGLDPKQNDTLANELKRTKEYLARLKQIEDRALAPHVNPGAAARFVRNALWEPKEKPGTEEPEKDGSDNGQKDSAENANGGPDNEGDVSVSNEPSGSKRTLSSIRPSESVEAKRLRIE